VVEKTFGPRPVFTSITYASPFEILILTLFPFLWTVLIPFDPKNFSRYPVRGSSIQPPPLFFGSGGGYTGSPSFSLRSFLSVPFFSQILPLVPPFFEPPLRRGGLFLSWGSSGYWETLPFFRSFFIFPAFLFFPVNWCRRPPLSPSPSNLGSLSKAQIIFLPKKNLFSQLLPC